MKILFFSQISHAKSRRWFSLVRLWQPWLAPRQGKSHFQLDKDGIMVSFLSNHGQHLVLLAISGTHDVMTVLKDDGHGKVVFHVSAVVSFAPGY